MSQLAVVPRPDRSLRRLGTEKGLGRNQERRVAGVVAPDGEAGYSAKLFNALGNTLAVRSLDDWERHAEHSDVLHPW